MCGCEFNFTCSRCAPRVRTDLVLDAGLLDPETPEELRDRLLSEHVDEVVLPAVVARG